MRLVYLILLLTLPAIADAAPVIPLLIVIASFINVYVMAALLIAQYALGERQKRKAARKARNDYNASLQERTITAASTDAPYVYVYGRARVGSAVVAIFTSGDKDQYKHIVSVHAAHECDAIEEIYISGKPVGELDAEGWVTGGDFYHETTEAGAFYVNRSTFTIEHDPIPGSFSLFGSIYGEIPFTIDGREVTITEQNEDFPDIIFYQYKTRHKHVRVSKHLGTAGDPVDSFLHNLLPDMWPATAVLRDFCYTVTTLDLNQPDFQAGLPTIEAMLRGKKLYDPRIGMKVWSQNNALVVRDYLRSEMCGIDETDIPDGQYIAAANVCDEQIDGLGARYTFNGTVTSEQDQENVLEQMALSMAGGIIPTSWGIYAGTYVAPVMSLSAEVGAGDIVGNFSCTPGVSEADLYNGVKGQYISSETQYLASDFVPYQNTAYVDADGKELWTNIDLPFTDSVQRVHNLCRIFVEEQRNGFTIKAQFSQKAWRLRVGDRVTLTSALFGWDSKIFRVTEKVFAPKSAIELTLKEDDPSIWDFADAVEPDSTPNTNLKSPFDIDKIASLTCESGTDHLLLMRDGTIVSRIKVMWPAISADAVEIEWTNTGIWNRITVSGSEPSAYLSPAVDGDHYTVRARAKNLYLNVTSDWTYQYHTVIGKSVPPPDVAAFSITNGVLSWPEISRDEIPDLAGYRIRFHYGRNDSLGDATLLHKGLLTASPYQPELMPHGPITLMITAVDTSGNESLNPAVIYHNFGDIIVDNLILSYDDKEAGFPGVKTNCAVVSGNLMADDSGDLFWGDDGAEFWRLDSAAFWPTATYKEMTYYFRYAVQPDEAGTRLMLSHAVEASAYNIEHRYDTQGEFWGNDANFFWGADSDLFWDAPTAWQTCPGAMENIPEGVIEFRITTQAGIVRGTVSELTLMFDVEDEYEEIDDVVISDAGTRLPLSKAYRSIKNIQLTLQADGGTAKTVKVLDKSLAGPLVACFDGSTQVSGLVDARVQGVKA